MSTEQNRKKEEASAKIPKTISVSSWSGKRLRDLQDQFVSECRDQASMGITLVQLIDYAVEKLSEKDFEALIPIANKASEKRLDDLRSNRFGHLSDEQFNKLICEMADRQLAQATN